MVIGKGEIDYFPGSQISIAPLEESLNGKLVVNGSIFPPIGKLNKPAEITMKDGRIIDVKGGTGAAVWYKYLKIVQKQESTLYSYLAENLWV